MTLLSRVGSLIGAGTLFADQFLSPAVAPDKNMILCAWKRIKVITNNNNEVQNTITGGRKRQRRSKEYEIRWLDQIGSKNKKDRDWLVSGAVAHPVRRSQKGEVLMVMVRKETVVLVASKITKSCKLSTLYFKNW